MMMMMMDIITDCLLPILMTRSIHHNKTLYHFRSTIPLTPSSIGFMAGVVRQKEISSFASISAVIDHSHQYMLDYCAGVVQKANRYLETVFPHESVEEHKLLKSTSFVFVNEPPEPYCVMKNLVLIDRDLLIGERVCL